MERLRMDRKDLLLLYILNSEKHVGRYILKDMLDLQEREGVVRSKLETLKSKGFIMSNRRGSTLTKQGMEYLRSLMATMGIIMIKKLDYDCLGVGPEAFGVQIRGFSLSELQLLDIRDSAVRGGAKGAVVFFFKNEQLTVPLLYEDLSEIDEKLSQRLQKTFNFIDGDLLIVGFNENSWRSLEGALSAIMYAIGERRAVS